MICSGPVNRLVARVVVVGVALTVAAAALVACDRGGDSGADSPTATVPTTPPDPYAVPAVIDEAYLNRVLAALDQAFGDVVRMVVSTKTLSPEAIQRLQALYVGDALNLQFQLFQADILNGLTGYKAAPGNVKTKATKLITVRPECVFAQVSRDYAEVSVKPDPRLGTQWVAIVPRNNHPGEYNETPWLYIYDGFSKTFSRPADPCEKSF
jgi:hypothetical protein